MKTKNLFLATIMAVFTLGMTGCDKNDDRLFDEPVEETIDYEKKYPLTLEQYKGALMNETRHVSEFAGDATEEVPVAPMVLNFFLTSNNLRGYYYRKLGEEGLKTVSELIENVYITIQTHRGSSTIGHYDDWSGWSIQIFGYPPGFGENGYWEAYGAYISYNERIDKITFSGMRPYEDDFDL